MDSLAYLLVIADQLDILSILSFCKVNKEAQELCNDPTLWNLLLKRDFELDTNLKSVTDPRKEYIRRLLRKLSGIFQSRALRFKEYDNDAELAISILSSALEAVGVSQFNEYYNFIGIEIGSILASEIGEHVNKEIDSDSLTLEDLISYIRDQELLAQNESQNDE